MQNFTNLCHNKFPVKEVICTFPELDGTEHLTGCAKNISFDDNSEGEHFVF